MLDHLPVTAQHQNNIFTQAPLLSQQLTGKDPAQVVIAQPHYTGKTRTLYELCSSRYAILFHAGGDNPESWSKDLLHLVRTFADEADPSLAKIIGNPLRALVLARLQVLSVLLQRFGSERLSPQDWLQAQIDPERHLGNADFFVNISTQLWNPSSPMKLNALAQAHEAIRPLVHVFQRIPVIVDDAENLESRCSQLFPATPSPPPPTRAGTRSILSLLANVALEGKHPLCLSGTPPFAAIARLAIPGAVDFSNFPGYTSAAQAWDSYVSRFLEEGEKKAFIDSAFESVAGRPGYLGLFCEKRGLAPGFNTALADTKEAIELQDMRQPGAISIHSLQPRAFDGPMNPDEQELLLNAVKIMGRRWVDIQKLYFPTRSAPALRRFFERKSKSQALSL